MAQTRPETKEIVEKYRDSLLASAFILSKSTYMVSTLKEQQVKAVMST